MTTNPFDFSEFIKRFSVLDEYSIIDQASKTTRELMEAQASFFKEMLETQIAMTLDMNDNFKRMFSGRKGD